MTETTQVTVQPKADAPPEWGSREEIDALANRYIAMIPGKKLSKKAALTLAQYAMATDANPFRGDVYAYEDGNKVVLIEGYKLLVRWARRQCQFYERYERITNDTDDIPEGIIAFRCRILRQDAVADLAELTRAGVPDAYKLCSIEAVGTVKRTHRPPEGWTVEEVARKRALKNALNRAYGAPSPKEIARETWMVEDTLTIPKDWSADVVTPIHQQELEAKYNAQQRLLAEAREAHPSTRSAAQDTAELYGEEIVSGETREIIGPEPATEEEPKTNGLDSLLEEVNEVLLELNLELYSSLNTMKAALKDLGHTSYKPASHETMRLQLISRNKPNGKDHGDAA